MLCLLSRSVIFAFNNFFSSFFLDFASTFFKLSIPSSTHQTTVNIVCFLFLDQRTSLWIYALDLLFEYFVVIFRNSYGFRVKGFGLGSWCWRQELSFNTSNFFSDCFFIFIFLDLILYSVEFSWKLLYYSKQRLYPSASSSPSAALSDPDSIADRAPFSSSPVQQGLQWH